MTSHKLSRVPRTTRDVPLEWGLFSGSIHSSTTSRGPEIDVHNRMWFGEAIPATNHAAAVYDPECIKCSHCGKRKHYTEFDKNRTYPWRFERQYECKACRKAIRLQGGVTIDPADEAYLRSKPNHRRKGRKGKAA